MEPALLNSRVNSGHEFGWPGFPDLAGGGTKRYRHEIARLGPFEMQKRQGIVSCAIQIAASLNVANFNKGTDHRSRLCLFQKSWVVEPRAATKLLHRSPSWRLYDQLRHRYIDQPQSQTHRSDSSKNPRKMTARRAANAGHN
jgi:hypothetical protein